MRRLTTIVIFTIVSTCCCNLLAQEIHFNIESKAFVSNRDNLQPHYQYANQWGVVSSLDESHALLVGGVQSQLLNNKHIQLKAGLSGVVKSDIGESFLHEVYLSGKAFNLINFNIGKEAYTPLSYNDELTVGGFFMNSNACPLPRVTMGIYDYVPLGFTNNWIEIKGGISQGFLNDNRTASGKHNSADNALLHEKWAYMRIGNLKVQPYMGLAHSSIFGGTRTNGDKIPIDFWATFFAKGSSKLGGGEETNAAGGHEGFWDFGLYTENDFGKFHLYWQKPFADASGLKLWYGRNRDYKLGLLSSINDFKWIKNISIEFVRTDYQSGAGIPDPLYPEGHPREGQIIWMYEIDDYDAFMMDTFGEETNGWGEEEVWEYLRVNENHGHHYGGRDDYNNNGSYYNGWTYHGQTMGLPLYHTYDQAKAYAPDWNPNNRVVLMNTRVRAFHIGLEGEFLSGLTYRFKSTFTRNFGSYSEEYVKRYSWTPVEDYYYQDGKNQTYSQLKINFQPKKWKNLKVQSSVSFDAGEMYHSFGWMIGINYCPSVLL
ncbi:hypothetical protein E9993_14135 [Labilibacter sediminis]|nr:hypothetical protein E9993_14135 [Labilibacter sediminis]